MDEPANVPSNELEEEIELNDIDSSKYGDPLDRFKGPERERAQQVKDLLQVGYDAAKIAQVLNVKENFVRRKYAAIFRTAEAELHRLALQSLRGSFSRSTSAAQFYLRTRAGWTETHHSVSEHISYTAPADNKAQEQGKEAWQAKLAAKKAKAA